MTAEQRCEKLIGYIKDAKEIPRPTSGDPVIRKVMEAFLSIHTEEDLVVCDTSYFNKAEIKFIWKACKKLGFTPKWETVKK